MPWQRIEVASTVGRCRRDAQEAEHVEASAARPSDGARAPQRGKRGGAEHGDGAAPVAGCSGSAECQVELGLALADSAEPRQA